MEKMKINAAARLKASREWSKQCLPKSAKLLPENKLASVGFFLEDAMNSWIADNDVILVMVPTSQCYSWEYAAHGGLKPDDPDILRMVKAWNGGRRLPVITGTFEADSRYRINDGQHRWLAWQIQKRHPNKFIPMLLNT